MVRSVKAVRALHTVQDQVLIDKSQKSALKWVLTETGRSARLPERSYSKS